MNPENTYVKEVSYKIAYYIIPFMQNNQNR